MEDEHGHSTPGLGSPWWAYIAANPSAAVAVIALGLVFFLAQDLTGVLHRMSVFMETHALQMDQMITDQKDTKAKLQVQWDTLANLEKIQHHDREAALRLEQQTCINTAKSEYQSRKCLEIRDDSELAIRP